MVDEAQQPTPEVWSLALLADKLKAGPPLLSEIINSLEDIDTAKAFLQLVREFLPAHEEEILSEPRSRRVYRFGYLFGKQYYPLPLNTDCGISALLSSMPVELMGMSYSAYHDLDMRLGYLLLLSLVIYPYEGDWRDDEDDRVPFDPMENLSSGNYKPITRDIDWLRNLVEHLSIDGVWVAPMGFTVVKVAENKIVLRDATDTPEVKELISRTLLVAKRAGIEAEFTRVGRTAQEKLNGARIPLLEMVRSAVGAEITSSIPAAGWWPEELNRITENTPYSGAGDFANWVCKRTGCTMLDSSHDNVEYMTEANQPIFKWSKENVLTLTEQWPKVQQIRGNIDKIVAWLESDPIKNFRELLDFILKNNPRDRGETESRSDDILDYFCALDQVREEEEEDAEEEMYPARF